MTTPNQADAAREAARQTDGKFGIQQRAEAPTGPGGVDLSPVLSEAHNHSAATDADGIYFASLDAVLADSSAGWSPRPGLTVLGNDNGLLDTEGRIDYLEISSSPAGGGPAWGNAVTVTGKADVREALLSSAASVYGPGLDEEADEEAALAWLDEHQDDLERVLVEDFGAALDPSRDEWDSQAFDFSKQMQASSTVGEAIEAIVLDPRTQPLHAMIAEENYEGLFDRVEKHARDRQTVRDLGIRAIDHLTNTLGNAAAKRARYLTLTHRWNGDGTKSFEALAYDSDANPLGEPVVISGLALERSRVPSDMTVLDSDPHEPRLLVHAANNQHMIDLDRAGSNAWGRATR